MRSVVYWWSVAYESKPMRMSVGFYRCPEDNPPMRYSLAKSFGARVMEMGRLERRCVVPLRRSHHLGELIRQHWSDELLSYDDDLEDDNGKVGCRWR